MKVCLFDIDGTLLSTAGAGISAFGQTFDDLFGVPELSSDISFAGQSDRGIISRLFAAHGVEDDASNWHAFQAGYLPRLQTELTKREGLVLPGVLQLIERLEAAGDVHLGLLTGNLREAAKIKLAHYNLWDRFAFGGYGDVHPDRNDIAAQAAQAARDHHGTVTTQEKIVVIGDTPNDIRCARAIGAYAVAVPTGWTSAETLAEAEPDLLTATLEENDAIVDWLAA